MKFLKIHLLLLILSLAGSAAEFRIEEIPDGNFRIFYGSEMVVDSVITSVTNNQRKEKRKTAKTILPDGGTAYNLWSEEPHSSFRTEVAVSGDGSEVEITYMTEASAYAPDVTAGKTLQLLLPFESWKGKTIEGYVGRATAEVRKKGVLADNAPDGMLFGADWRFLTVTDGKNPGFIFDFNPVGPGDFISIYKEGALRGLWKVLRRKDKIQMIGGSVLLPHGGFTGAKIRILRGTTADYDRLHAMRKFFYTQQLEPELLLSFGSDSHGKEYTPADTAAFEKDKRYGWLSETPLKNLNSGKPGAFYSAVAGSNGVFRIEGLRAGYWFITVAAGNSTGIPNQFSISCNGKTAAEKTAVAPKEAVITTIPLHIDESGCAELRFDGEFLLSTLAAQFLMADAEDFSIRRGPWVTDGYEPSVLFRNEHYRPAPEMIAVQERIPLPDPGSEMASPAKPLHYPKATPSADAPGLRYRYNAVIGNCLGNSATLAEYKNEAALAKFLDEQEKNHVNLLIVSGLHSRHTYFRHLARSREAIQKIAVHAHERGMKVIDHHDVTLLWNLDAGFRLMTEQPDRLTRSVRNNLPGPQYCILNPEVNRAYTEYLLEQVRGGIDGFMIDEIMFYPDCCGCSYCRKQFHADTGWQLPMNELDPFFTSNSSPLRQYWQKWRMQQVGNWWVSLRKKINEINPDITLLNYTTHYGFTSRYATCGMGADLIQAARGADFFGTEIMSRNILRSVRAIAPFRNAQNLLRIAFGTPIWGLITTQNDWDGAYFGWAVNNMHAQNPWINHPVNNSGRRAFLSFADRNMDFLKAQPVAEVALLFSSSSRDWAPAGGFPGELFGTAQTMETMHLPYEIIGEQSLNPAILEKYKVLIVAGAPCLSDAEIREIRNFAARGGKVFLTGNAGLYDENGKARSSWPFADIFSMSPELRSSMKNVIPCSKHREHRLAGIQVQQLPDGSMELRHRTFGKGTFYYHPVFLASKLYAEEGTPGRVWTFELDRSLDTCYKEMLREICRDAGTWEIDAPEMVLTTLYRQGNALWIHLLNATGSRNEAGKPMLQPLPSPAFPALDKDIVFRISFPELKRATAVSPDFPGEKEISFRKEASGMYQITLPKDLLEVYTIVKLQ